MFEPRRGPRCRYRLLGADIGKTGMGGREVPVGGECGLELAFGLGDETLREVFVAKLGVLRGLFGWRQRGHTGCANLVEKEGLLPERGFRKSAANAFLGVEAACGDAGVERRAGEMDGGGDAGAEFCSLLVSGMELEGSGDLGLCGGGDRPGGARRRRD